MRRVPVIARAAEVRMTPVAAATKPLKRIIATLKETAKLFAVRLSVDEIVFMVFLVSWLFIDVLTGRNGPRRILCNPKLAEVSRDTRFRGVTVPNKHTNFARGVVHRKVHANLARSCFWSTHDVMVSAGIKRGFGREATHGQQLSWRCLFHFRFWFPPEAEFIRNVV